MTVHTAFSADQADVPNVSQQTGVEAGRATLLRWSCDPLEEDASTDEIVMMTPRRLLRLAIAAADTGARFAREGLDHDPVAWLIAPRRLFGGHSAMDACQDLEHFQRSVVLHGLNIGLDAAPSDIDALLVQDQHEDEEQQWSTTGAWANDADRTERMLPRPRLLSCSLDAIEGDTRLFAFCAMVTDRPADLVERIIGRYGVDVAADAKFSTGFDRTSPMARALISDALEETLTLAASDAESPLVRGLDVVVEQRVSA